MVVELGYDFVELFSGSRLGVRLKAFVIVKFVAKSTLANSNSLGDRKNVRIIKSSNYRYSNYRGFLFGDFQGT